jgi:hypothetical protein
MEKINKTARGKSGGGNAGYMLGLIGSMVFYIQQASGFWPVIGAVLKGFVWPAFVVYDLLKFTT